MNKLQTIITEVAAEVRKEMEQSILKGAYGMHFEKVYGNAYVDIDIFVERNHGALQEVAQVMVSHIDTAHRSPLLEEAIAGTLPCWFDMYHKIFWEDSRQTA